MSLATDEEAAMNVRTVAALAGVVALTLGAATAAGADDPDARAVRPVTGPVVVQDVDIAVPGQAPTRAYLVRPAGAARPRSLAGILYLHWLEPPDVTQNRTEFLDEAVQAARRGAVALLPDLTFPWNFDVVGDQRDADSVRAQLAAVARAYHALLAQPGVDARRTAVVGHDYGAMYAALLAQQEPRIHSEVFMAGDATWSNWFATYFVDVPDPAAYDRLFAGLDPVDDVSRLGAHLYFQWAGQDQFVSPAVRDRFAAADPAGRVSLYPNAHHNLDQHAKDDRVPWLYGELGLS
jgi:dienelactone hydrolase